MASTEALRNGVRALFPESVHPFFGSVPPGTTVPWTFVLLSLPSPTERRLCGRISNRRCVMRLRIAAGNDTAVLQLWDMMRPSLEGVRPVVDGWQLTRLSQLNDDPQVYPDRDVTLPGGGHPIVAAVDFEFHATEINQEETP